MPIENWTDIKWTTSKYDKIVQQEKQTFYVWVIPVGYILPAFHVYLYFEHVEWQASICIAQQYICSCIIGSLFM